MTLRLLFSSFFSLVLISAPAAAQRIEEIPASKPPGVYRPDDLFQLPPGQWHYAKHLWKGAETCTEVQCEAGFTSGDLALSVEHSNGWVRVITGFRNCRPVAFSEIETGKTPGRSTRSKVEHQVERVVKGAARQCKVAVPAIANLDVSSLFPAGKKK